MKIAILGGGIQGACVAMELASAGFSVDIYEKNSQCLTQASAQNEGKIHLGYIYGNDRTLKTARTMVQGAVTFATLLRKWIGSDIDTIPVSTPFLYAVHADSILNINEVEKHLHDVNAIIAEESRGMPIDYFGSDYHMLPERISESECNMFFERGVINAAFRTPEISIDSETLAKIIRARLLSDPKICCITKSFIKSATPDPKGVTIAFEVDGHLQNARYEHVVNTLWEGRLAVDRTAGIEPPYPWLYRVKYFLQLQNNINHVPSISFVLGPFGDVIAYNNGKLDLSWYPIGMRQVSAEITMPNWPQTIDNSVSSEIKQGIITNLEKIVPTLKNINPAIINSGNIKCGIIFAWGKTDIDDPKSILHKRHSIGPYSYGKYHTIDTGKLTTAPFFGKIVADRIKQIG